MKGCKISISDAMGFPIEERYFTSLSKAKKEFKKAISKGKKDVNFAADEDISWQQGSKKYHDVNLDDKRVRKSITLPFWWESNTENGHEYDITWESITLENIEIEE